MTARIRKIAYFLRAWFHIWLVTKYANIIYRAIYCVRGPTIFFFLDKIIFISIDKIDSLYFHGSLQCVVIQKFSLNKFKIYSGLDLDKEPSFLKIGTYLWNHNHEIYLT